MSQITLTDPTRATEAAGWLQYNRIEWNLDVKPFGSIPRYIFSFNNQIDAAFFALKWA